jgi:hypothetical protein
MVADYMKTISDNESFVFLMAAAAEDEALRGRLLSVLRQDDLVRADQISSWLGSCALKGAPVQFTEAISYLSDKDVANTVIKYLCK